MSGDNISQEFKLKNIDETRNCSIGEINKNELMSKKHNIVYSVLNYAEHLFIFITLVTGCLFISAFASLFGIYVRITSSAIGLKISVIAAGIKKCKSIIKKRKKKHNKFYRSQNLN